MEAKRILIIEDDQRIAQTISKGLVEQGMQTEIAYDGKIGTKYAVSGNFDLILLDLNFDLIGAHIFDNKIIYFIMPINK